MDTVTIEYKVNDEEAWPSQKAAEHLGVNPSRVRQFVRQGELEPCASVNGPGGRMWLFWPADVKKLRNLRAHSRHDRSADQSLLSPEAMEEVRRALDVYVDEVRASSLAPKSQQTYIRGAENLIRWLHGDFVPGRRK